MQRRRCIIVLAFVLCLPLRPSAGTAPANPVDTYIQAEMTKRQIPGLALVVIRDGEVVKMQGYGFANLEHDVPVTPDTVFELASVTKQFTAAAVMRLVEEGKVGLRDPIRRYVPDAPDTWKDITVRHLLTHTAGLAGLRHGFQSLYIGGRRLNYTTAQMLDAATKDPMSFAPGAHWQYSDVGYFLLGMVIEHASGQRYRDFLADRFFQPLGMTSTSVLDQWAIVKHRAAGYTLRDGQLVNIRRVAQVALPSHYGVFSTVRDLAPWEHALAAGHVVKPSSLAQMWTPVTLNNGLSYPYGFGWFVDEWLGHRMITHTGITGTEYTRFPDDNLTVIVLTNLGWHPGWPRVHAWGLTQAVAGRYVPSLLFSSIPEPSQTQQALTQKLQGLLSSMAKGESSPSMAPGLNAALNAERRNVLAAHLKALTSFIFLACEDVSGRAMERHGVRISRLCYYKMHTEPETRYYMFWLTADDLVAEYQSFTE